MEPVPTRLCGGYFGSALSMELSALLLCFLQALHISQTSLRTQLRHGLLP